MNYNSSRSMRPSEKGSLFTSVRSKLRQSRSSVILRQSNSSCDLRQEARPNLNFNPWTNLPVEYQPVQITGVRVVQGTGHDRWIPPPPPQHPPQHTPNHYVHHFITPNYVPPPPTRRPPPPPVSPQRPKSAQLYGGAPLLSPEPYIDHRIRKWRRRSAQETLVPWQVYGDDDRSKIALPAAIAIALPPEHLDPPPPYSIDTPTQPVRPQTADNRLPESTGTTNRTALWIEQIDVPLPTTMPTHNVPTIAAPQPPTPVSPLNELDREVLATREYNRRRVSVDVLLSHPLLQH